MYKEIITSSYQLHWKNFDRTQYRFWQYYICYCRWTVIITAKRCTHSIAALITVINCQMFAVACNNNLQMTVVNLTQTMALIWLYYALLLIQL